MHKAPELEYLFETETGAVGTARILCSNLEGREKRKTVTWETPNGMSTKAGIKIADNGKSPGNGHLEHLATTTQRPRLELLLSGSLAMTASSG